MDALHNLNAIKVGLEFLLLFITMFLSDTKRAVINPHLGRLHPEDRHKTYPATNKLIILINNHVQRYLEANDGISLEGVRYLRLDTMPRRCIATGYLFQVLTYSRAKSAFAGHIHFGTCS